MLINFRCSPILDNRSHTFCPKNCSDIVQEKVRWEPNERNTVAFVSLWSLILVDRRLCREQKRVKDWEIGGRWSDSCSTFILFFLTFSNWLSKRVTTRGRGMLMLTTKRWASRMCVLRKLKIGTEGISIDTQLPLEPHFSEPFGNFVMKRC